MGNLLSLVCLRIFTPPTDSLGSPANISVNCSCFHSQLDTVDNDEEEDGG